MFKNWIILFPYKGKKFVVYGDKLKGPLLVLGEAVKIGEYDREIQLYWDEPGEFVKVRDISPTEGKILAEEIREYFWEK